MAARLIGFDIREDWLAPDDVWDAPRRRQYLLRVDVPKPLSVDPVVWPSVFRVGDGDGFIGDLLRPLGVFAVPAPPWIGPTGSLWEDLSLMRAQLAAAWDRPRSTVTVAVAWLPDPSDDESAGPVVVGTSPAETDDGWTLLGYDVADRWLLSGLANCGYDGSEIDGARDRWAASLNAGHLFDDPAAAFAFRDETNARVPEHAPFFVYAVYRVPDVKEA